jgi:hypothetical protein
MLNRRYCNYSLLPPIKAGRIKILAGSFDFLTSYKGRKTVFDLITGTLTEMLVDSDVVFTTASNNFRRQLKSQLERPSFATSYKGRKKE